jgi:hypothetical protein
MGPHIMRKGKLDSLLFVRPQNSDDIILVFPDPK